MKPRHMLTWMLWSAAACLSSQGHGQVLVDQRTSPEIDSVVAASALTLFLGGLALARAGWASRRDGRG